MVSERQKHKDRMDAAGLAVSTTSLLVSTIGVIAAICLNKKEGENNMAEESPAMQYKRAKQQKKEATKQRKATKMSAKADKISKQTHIREEAKKIGYNGPIIMLNEKGGIRIRTKDGEQTYKLVPVSSQKSKPASRSAKKPSARTPVNRTRAAPKQDRRSWVAMEINSRNGESQAIVCPTMADAEARAMAMKRAHRTGSQPSKDCKQGYALMDTSKGIDVRNWFYGYHDGKLYRV